MSTQLPMQLVSCVDIETKYDRCIQVVFAHKSILVVRARSIHLFSWPTLQLTTTHSDLIQFPIAQHTFGWIDGVSVSLSRHRREAAIPFASLSILIRAESDDPWASEAHHLDLYTLEPNPSFDSIESNIPPAELLSPPVPYIFPPVLSATVHSVRGSLRCTDVIMGSYGTALWIHPHDRAVAGLVSPEAHSFDGGSGSTPHEKVVTAVFPGPFLASKGNDNAMHGTTVIPVKTSTMFTNPLNNWTALDYNEVLGRIALGSSYGRITILKI